MPVIDGNNGYCKAPADKRCGKFTGIISYAILSRLKTAADKKNVQILKMKVLKNQVLINQGWTFLF
jgi:hypothetical protein